MFINIKKLNENLRSFSLLPLKLTALLLIVLLFNPLYAQKNDRFLSIYSKADLIIHAKVVSTQSRWVNDNRGKHIYTSASLQVFKSLKGNYSQSYLDLETIGGKVGDITEVVSDSYTMKKDDEFILLLRSNPISVIDGNQGIITIYNNKIALANYAVSTDEFINTFSGILNNKIKIKSIEEFENAAILNRVKSGTATSDSLKKIVQDNKDKNLKLNGDNSLAAPNLYPYKPGTWGDKIVVKKNSVTLPIENQLASDDTPLYDSDPLYLAFAVANGGTMAATSFNVKIYIDNVAVINATAESLDSGYYLYWYNYPINLLSSGAHTIKIIVDPDNLLAETNETDNEYSRSVTIQHLAGTPLITSITPSTASAGTGTNVTIAGSGFGATRGTSLVEFFYKSGSSKISPSSYISWSDNQIVCEVPAGTVDSYPASAASGPVTVLTAAGRSNGFNLSVLFGYGGVKWPGTFPVVIYKINENYPAVVGEKDAITAAMDTWNGTGANFRLNYGGASTATTSGYDSENSVTFGTTGTSIATNYYWSVGGTLVESDIVFNSAVFSFSTDGTASTYDIQSIATHELGHALNLRDLYGTSDSDKMMYGFSTAGTTKRSLSSGDVSGIQYIYGTGGSLSEYSISGTITFNGNPLAGVTVSRTGTSSQSMTTSTDGNYSFSGLITGNYTITPSKTGYSFSPASQTFNNLNANQTQNFTASVIRFTITASSTGSGTISPGGDVQVDYGASQAFTITPNSGYHTGTVLVDGVSVGAVTNYSFSNVTANHTIAVTFLQDTFLVSLSANPSTGGTTGGAGSFASGSSVTVTATPNSGYSFTNWTEGAVVVSTSSSYTFTLTGNKTLVANFAVIPPAQYTVTLASNPASGGTTGGGGTFDSGTSITVTAAPNNGYTFTNWTEGVAVVSASSSYTFTLTGNRTLSANFSVIQYTITTASNPPAGGTTAGSGTFNAGSSVTVTAAPNSEYEFTNWTEGGIIVSTNSAYTFTLNQNRNLTALFTSTVAIEKGKEAPSGFELMQNYPNPFNATTMISYSIQNSDNVKLVISDLTGRVISTLVNEFKGAGTHQVSFNALNLPSGTYLYTITAGSYTQTKKLILLK